MAGWSRPTTDSSSSRLAGHSNNWKIPSIVSHNVNSLSTTNTGGIAGRFAKIVALLGFLLLSHTIVCLQDIRIPTNNFLSQLRTTYKNYTFTASANDTNSGGVVTIFPTALTNDYTITHDHIYSGYILATKFSHKHSPNHFSVINTYLHASDPSVWHSQILALDRYNKLDNSVFVGDMNHAPDNRDRSGYHKDKPSYCQALFNSFIEKNEYEEIYQKYHTCYSSKNGRLVSSRIDHAYHNFPIDRLAFNCPKISVLTMAPYTVTRGSCCPAPGSDWDGIDNHDDVIDRQLVSRVTTKTDGGSHITDHLPLSIRFYSPETNVKRRFASRALNSDDFRVTYDKLWYQQLRGENWATDMHDVKKTLCDTSHKTKNNINNYSNKNFELWEAIRMLGDIEDGLDDISFRYDHIPDYLDLANDTSKLVDKINKDFAVVAYSSNNKTPISKLQTIAKTLPSGRKRLTHLYDRDSDSITADPVRLTDIATGFWANKWDCRHIHNPKALFEIYGKKIQVQPTPITLDMVVDVINNTDDSAPGPDGIPFAAYRAVVEQVAPIFLTAIQKLMSGDTPPRDFNAGILHLLPKKATDRIEDTRPLVINNTDNRIIAAVIQASIQPAVESYLSNNQNGFRPDRTTFTNIDYLNERFYKAMEEGRFCDILFVDFLKAFDSISHEAIFGLLHHLGFSVEYQNIIRSLFHNAHCYTNFKGAKPSKIHFNSGVKQGCPLSPTLFIMVVDVLIDMLESIGGIDPRMFADDTSIVSDDITLHLPQIKATFATFKKYTGLEMNAAKSAIIATGGRTDLRSALDNVGWSALRISGCERYLGTYMGHEVTLDDVFKPPYDKFVDRLTHYKKIKHLHSLQNRVIIWNTWLLTIFNYIFNLYIIPTDYLGWIDSHCVDWLDSGKTMKTLYLSRPTELAGLTTPLRDTTLANYSALASRAGSGGRGDQGIVWSLRVSDHRAKARDFLQAEYGIDALSCKSSADYYRKALHSTTLHTSYANELKRKLNKIDMTDKNHSTYLSNAKRAPHWIPSYARFTNIAISHNALFTAKRLNKTEKCYLCGKGQDDMRHIWGDCSVAKNAHNKFWVMLATRRDFNICAAICADDYCTNVVVGAQYMLTDSIWRARNCSYHGLCKDASGWCSWIIDNALIRIKSCHPHIFNKYFKNNTVPNRYKITYSADMGSSSRNDSHTRDTAAHVVGNLLSKLPNGAIYAFTDGSANPNPGPTGSGVAIYRKNGPGDELVDSLAAPLGHADNNAGELHAVGMVYEYVKNFTNIDCIHIFTDSSITRGALEEGWNAGRANKNLLHAVRRARRSINLDSKIYWIPGHSGLPQNDYADYLAGNASAKSADMNITYNINNYQSSNFNFLANAYSISNHYHNNNTHHNLDN